jgi:hypothetical protein
MTPSTTFGSGAWSGADFFLTFLGLCSWSTISTIRVVDFGGAALDDAFGFAYLVFLFGEDEDEDDAGRSIVFLF